MNDIQNLLNQVSIIVKKNNEIIEANGGRFNLFGILGVDHYENTHSAIINEFLNPKGSHGLKDQFLKAFLNLLIEEFKKHPKYGVLNTLINMFKTESALATTEYPTSFGRIDILVEDNKGHAIIIENKIYAVDQWEQLSRYNKFAKSKYEDGNFIILYLTLFGIIASEYSGKNVNYYQISHSTFIIKWLEQCVNLSARFPLVRETLNQYNNHLKQLTNQDMDTKNKENIVKILSSSVENLQAAFSIFENIGALKDYIVSTYFNSQLQEIAKELDIRVASELQGRKTLAGFGFEVPDWKYFKICFEFDGNDWMKLGYMYCLKNKNEKPNETITKLYPNFERHNDNPNIPCGYSYKMKYSNWNIDAFLAIHSGEMKNEIERVVKKMIAQAKDLEM